MNKLKYALYHGKFIILILIIALYFLTSFIFNIIAQYNSTTNGIEMLFVDTWVSVDGNDGLIDNIKNTTAVEYIGSSTISEKEITDYVKTISNYTVTDHLNVTVEANDVEILFIPERLLDDVYRMNAIVPLEMEGEFDEICYYNGILYAFPLNNVFVTKHEGKVVALENTYAVLLNGDHVEYLRDFLKNLPTEEK